MNYKNALAVAGVIIAAGCGSGPQRPAVSNPMPAIWANIESSIDKLVKTHATPTEWAKAAESSERITEQGQLTEALRNSGLGGEVTRSVLEEWNKQPDATHYGFEADHHALVFFDSGRSKKVFRW